VVARCRRTAWQYRNNLRYQVMTRAGPANKADQSALAVARPYRVLAFGDSNTFGSQPSALAGGPAPRYASDERWPGVAQRLLGSGFEIIESGLPGRTLDVDAYALPADYGPSLSGALALPIAIRSNNPIDLVVLMLGTNDCKSSYARDSSALSAAAERLLAIVAHTNSPTVYPAPMALLVAPPPLDPSVSAGRFGAEFSNSSLELSQRLGRCLSAVVRLPGQHFFDAAAVVRTDGIDGLHLSANAHQQLGAALAERIRAVLTS
jgi:lysophospholipase L1-like esterase